jgi:Ca2+:H+ antiporter
MDSRYNLHSDVKGESAEYEAKKEYSFIAGSRSMLFNGPLNILLPAAPIAFISYGSGWPDGVTFVFSLLAIAPFAERLGFVTEQIALHTNDTVGGLLNATFGNATELIVAIAALSKGLYRLVQLSLLGSILSNLLLVLGCAFFFGGLYHKEQYFGVISSQINSTLLMASVMGILFPTAMTYASEDSHLTEIGFSRATSFALFILYFAFLYFQLFTHKEIYDSVVLPTPKEEPKIDKKEPLLQNNAEEEDEDEDILGLRYGIVWLTIITIFIAFLSDALVATIENSAKGSGCSAVFLSTIVIPIVGNAAEHASAVTVAMKNKLDLSLGVAVGSSTQIALMVLPMLVLIGWCIDKDLSLNFHAYEAVSVALTVILVTFAIKDGKSNWLLGFILIIAYFIIAFGFFAEKDEDLDSQ